MIKASGRNSLCSHVAFPWREEGGSLSRSLKNYLGSPVLARLKLDEDPSVKHEGGLK